MRLLKYKAIDLFTPEQLDSEEEYKYLLDSTVISWDGGNGTSSAWYIRDEKLQYFTLPNVRVQVTGFKMNTEVTTIGMNEMVYAEVASGRFGIGDGIWEQSHYPPQTFVNSEERYGSEIHIFMLLCLLAALNAPEDTPLTIIASAPPGLANTVSKPIKRALLNGEAGDRSGVWTIQMSYDKKPRTFIIGKVVVVPEGLGAYAAYAYSPSGSAVLIPSLIGDDNDDALTGQVAIHDAGQGTYDTYMVSNGRLDAESMAHATDPNGGILRQMVEPIIDYIRDQFVRAGQPVPALKPIQVDSWLRAWADGGMQPKYARIKLHGLILDLQAIFDLQRRNYARYVIEEKLTRSWQQGTDTVMLVGGGWVYIVDIIKKQYPNKNILEPRSVPHLKNIPLWELNAYGGLPLVAFNQRIKAKVID